MNWIRQLFSRAPRGGSAGPDPRSRPRPPGPPDPHIQRLLAQSSRAERARAQFVMNALVKRTLRPERTLRYFAVMARREIGRQRAHLTRTEDAIFQLEQALDIFEEEIEKCRT